MKGLPEQRMVIQDLNQRIVTIEQQVCQNLEVIENLKAELRMIEESFKPRPHGINVLSPPQIVEHVLRNQDEPITTRRLKDLIQETGYPISRFGESWRYLYLLLGRLKTRGKIFRDGDEISLEPVPMVSRARETTEMVAAM